MKRESMAERAERLKREQENAGKGNSKVNYASLSTNTNPGISSRSKRNRSQILQLLAPVTKTTIEFRLAEVEPERCVAHPANRRNQAMLRPSNPKIIEIKDRILKVGGVLEPVKAVLGSNDDDRYRLLDGSSRRYALELANEEMRQRALQHLADSGVDVSTIDPEDLEEKVAGYYEENQYSPRLPMLLAQHCSPEDAAEIARTANEARSDESPWELAQAIEHYRRTNNKELTQQDLAVALGVTRHKVARALTYEGIPEKLMLKFDSPSTLSESVAKYVLKVATKNPKTSLEEIIQNVSPTTDSVYSSATQFKRDLDEYLKTLEVKDQKVEIGQRYVFERSGHCELKLTRNRSKSDQFKIDIRGLSAHKLAELEKLLDDFAKS